MQLPLRRFIRGALLVSAAVAVQACADSSRGPTSPSAAQLSTRALSWACGRTVPAGTADGWSFAPPDGCPATVALPDVGIGAITAAPANFRSTVTGTTVRLDWDAVPDAVSFLIEAGSAPTFADLARLNSGSAAPALVVNNVPAGVYFVRVRAVGADGIAGPPSNEITVSVGVAGSCAAAPLPAAGLAVAVDGSRVTLTWVAPVGGDALASYIVEAGTAPTLRNAVVFDTGLPATRLEAQAPTGLYYARIRGRNACGIGAPSNEVLVAVGTPAPQQPPNPQPPTNPQPPPNPQPPVPPQQPPGGGEGGTETTCTYAVAPSEVFLAATAGVFDVRVTTAAGCAWTANSSSFVSVVAGGSSSGSGSARFSVSANTGASTRQASVRISFTGGGLDVAVSQVGTPPAPPPSGPPIETVVQVTTQTGITNQLIPNPPPSTRPNAQGCTNCPVLGAAAVAGSIGSSVSVQLNSANGVPFNTVIIATGDQVAGTPAAASYYLVQLDDFTTSASFILAVPPGQTFTLQFAVAVNGELPVNYVPVVIALACTFTVTGPASQLPSTAGTFDVAVSTTAGCPWTAVSQAVFIQPTSGSGPGSGTARFSIAENSTTSARSGTVRVAGVDLTVTQAAAPAGAGSFLGSIAATPAAPFGGASCPYTQQFTNVAIQVAISQGTVTAAAVTATGVESVLAGCSATAIPPNQHRYTLQASAILLNGTSIKITFAQAQGQPNVLLTLDGTISGNTITGTLTFRRVDNASLPWTVEAPVTLNRSGV